MRADHVFSRAREMQRGKETEITNKGYLFSFEICRLIRGLKLRPHPQKSRKRQAEQLRR